MKNRIILRLNRTVCSRFWIPITRTQVEEHAYLVSQNPRPVDVANYIPGDAPPGQVPRLGDREQREFGDELILVHNMEQTPDLEENLWRAGAPECLFDGVEVDRSQGAQHLLQARLWGHDQPRIRFALLCHQVALAEVVCKGREPGRSDVRVAIRLHLVPGEKHLRGNRGRDGPGACLGPAGKPLETMAFSRSAEVCCCFMIPEGNLSFL